MKKIKQVSTSNNDFIATIGVADSFISRLIGLLGQKDLLPYHGLLIKPCHQVHSIGMLFPISVWFLDEQHRILKIIDDLQPFRISPAVKKCACVLEFPQNWAETMGAQEGDYLIIE